MLYKINCARSEKMQSCTRAYWWMWFVRSLTLLFASHRGLHFTQQSAQTHTPPETAGVILWGDIVVIQRDAIFSSCLVLVPPPPFLLLGSARTDEKKSSKSTIWIQCMHYPVISPLFITISLCFFSSPLAASSLLLSFSLRDKVFGSTGTFGSHEKF